MQNAECHMWEVGNWSEVGLRSHFVGRAMCGLSVERVVYVSIEVLKIIFFGSFRREDVHCQIRDTLFSCRWTQCLPSLSSRCQAFCRGVKCQVLTANSG